MSPSSALVAKFGKFQNYLFAVSLSDQTTDWITEAANLDKDPRKIIFSNFPHFATRALGGLIIDV